MKNLRRLSSFVKSNTAPTDDQFNLIKSRLLNTEWHTQEDALSPSPARQIFVTLQSLLGGSHTPFIDLDSSKSLDKGKTATVDSLLKKGLPLPPGYTLAYCNPLSDERYLGSDGYDNYHAPVLNNMEFFKRRMWVNGSFTFNNENPLTFGNPIFFKETMNSVRFLRRSKMIFTDYNREFSNQNGLSVKESRGLCYIEDVYKFRSSKGYFQHDTPDEEIVVTPSILTNFRMSAITFNSHQIHYNPSYAKFAENYEDAVIEAPLLISLALQFWCSKNPKQNINRFKYKITMPTYVNRPLSIKYKRSGRFVKLWISNESSLTCFDSTIEL